MRLPFHTSMDSSRRAPVASVGKRILCLFVLGCFLLAGHAGADSPDLDSIVAQGDQWLDSGNPTLAKELYKEAIKQAPRRDDLWRKFEEALLEHFRKFHAALGASDSGSGSTDVTPGSAASPPEQAGIEPSSGSIRDDRSLYAAGWNPASTPAPSSIPSPPPVSLPEPGSLPPELTGPVIRGPSETIYLEPPVRPSDRNPVASREDGRDVVIGTATYELSKIKFHVDRQGSLHISGQANNLSDRDFRNPRVYVHLYDTNLVEWALKYGSMVRSSSVLFRSHAAEFDVSFPAFSRTVGAYRIYMNY